MKIALCLSGKPRSSMFCFPYIYESFINLEPQYEVDVYIHSWNNFRAIDLYNPLKIKIEPNKEEEIRSSLLPPYNTHSILNHHLMYYSMSECFRLIEKPYDIYIRCRLDLIFESKLILYPIFSDILKEKYDIFSLHSDYPTKLKGGIDDQILISNYRGLESLISYKNQIFSSSESYSSFTKSTGRFYAEGLLKKYLDKQNIKIIHNPLSNYRLVRNSQVITDGPFNFLDQ